MKKSSGADHHAEAGVDRELGEEIAAEPARGVVHRDRHAVQVARAEQADQPVAQILALQQDEDGDDEDDRGREQRAYHRHQDALRDLKRGQGRLMHLDRHRGRRRGGGGVRRCGHGFRLRLRAGDVAYLLGQGCRHALQTADRHGADGVDLLLHRVLVARHVAREARDLRADQPGDGENHAHRQHHGQDRRQHAPEPRPA